MSLTLTPNLQHPPQLKGEVLAALPSDLYIPPDALEVVLDSFTGPLDLLLYLIRKAELDILDIPMSELTAQYLVYVDLMRTRKLELAAEYLLMAALLIEIKSRLLLPKPPTVAGVEAEDPRAELVRRLIEYEQMKLAAHLLQQLPQAERDFYWANADLVHLAPPPPEVELTQLLDAWHAISRRVGWRQSHLIERESLSVREHMGLTLLFLRQNTETYVEFHHLTRHSRQRAVIVVYFLAMLELVREQLVDVSQAGAYTPIYLCLRHRPIESDQTLRGDMPLIDDAASLPAPHC